MTDTPVADRVAEAIIECWGERCPDYAPGCPCCDAWAQYDALTAQDKRIEELEAAIRPFADISDLFDSEVEGHSDTDELSLFYGDGANWLADRFTFAQFRAARAALEKGGE